MLETLTMFSKFLIMTFGGFFTPFILSKGIRQIETESTGSALIASIILGGALSGLLFLLYPNLLMTLVSLFLSTFLLFISFVYTEKESYIKTGLAGVIALIFYGLISWVYLPFPTGFFYSLIFFISGFALSLEEENKIIIPLIAFILVMFLPFVKVTSIKIANVGIPLAAITHIIPFIILLIAAAKKWGEVIGGWGITSYILLLVLAFLFYAYPIPGLPPEVMYYGKVAGKELERQMQLYKRYLEIYRAIQQNETLRKLYSAGEYEIPEEKSLILEPNKGLIISYKEDDILKEWDTDNNRIHIEIMGKVENPLETPIQVLIVPSVLNLEGLTNEEETVAITPESLSISCKFMKEELPTNKENSKLQEILENYNNTGDIEIIYKKSFEPFECEVDLSGIPSNIIKIWFTFQINLYYDVFTSAILELDLIGKEKYTSLLRFEKLKEKNLNSYSTWGPLKGVINIFGYEKNPIPIEGSKDLTLYLYTINNVPQGTASMRCYILAIPKIDSKILIDTIPTGCYDFTSNPEDISKICEIDISKEDSLYYGFTIYNGYFQEIDNSYDIIVCNDFSKEFTYKGDPTKSEEVKVFKILIQNFGPYEEIILFPQAHFIYTFRDLREIPILLQR